jgi:hypothetical protein
MFWKDCPFPVTLVTDRGTEPWDLGQRFDVGDDRGWCKNLLAFVKDVPEDKVLLLQEDFWLNFPTDTAFINRAVAAMNADPKIAAFRIYPCPGPEGPINEEYGLLRPGSAYRVSCQATIWRKDELVNLLERFDHPRDFEIQGTIYANAERAHLKYVAVEERDPNKWPIQYYCSAITRGEFDRGALEFCKKMGVPVHEGRPIMGGPR